MGHKCQGKKILQSISHSNWHVWTCALPSDKICFEYDAMPYEHICIRIYAIYLLYINLYIYIFIYLSIYLFIDLFIYLFIYLLPFNNSCKQECHVRSHLQCMFMGMSAGKCNLIAMHLYVCVLRHLCFQRHRNCICASCFFHASVRVWASTFVWIHLLAHLKLSARIFTSVSARLCLLIPFDSHIWVLRAFMGMLNGSPHLQHFLYGLLSHSQDFR